MSISERQMRELREGLTHFGLKKYQAGILACAMLFGEAPATVLGKAAKVPSARVYETLSELGGKGLVKVRPGRPMICTALSPKETVGRLLSLKRTDLESELRQMESLATSLTQNLSRARAGLHASFKRSPLVRVVDVGEPSEQETRSLYRKAKKRILVFSRAFEYLPRVIRDLADTVQRGAAFSLILLDPSRLSPESVDVQNEMIALLRSKISTTKIRFSSDVPVRGSIIDPDGQGAAIFLAEETGVPLFVREAAVSENMGVVRGLAKLFDLMWEKLPTTNIV